MSWTAMFAGLAAGANTLGQLGMMQLQHQQKIEDEKRENDIWMRRQRLLESMKAPAERSRTIDNPDKPGQKILVREVWQPPADDNTPGKYQEVGREPITPKYVKDKRTLPGNKEEDILVNENDPTDVHAIPGSAPRDIYDPEGAKRTAIEAGNQGISAQRLDFEKKKYEQDRKDKLDADKIPHDRYSIHPGENGGYVAFDKSTRKLITVKPDQQDQVVDPSDVVVVDPTNPSSMVNHPPLSPLSQFDRAPAGNTPPASGIGPSGGAGSQGSMGATPAKGASAKGPPVARKMINGVLWYKYADGSTAPAQ